MATLESGERGRESWKCNLGWGLQRKETLGRDSRQVAAFSVIMLHEFRWLPACLLASKRPSGMGGKERERETKEAHFTAGREKLRETSEPPQWSIKQECVRAFERRKK